MTIWKERLTVLLLLLTTLFATVAQQRRPIDSQHPLWMVHIDVWNAADPQKIIDLVPDEVKPFVCMNLSLSCQYDIEKDVYLMPQNAIKTYKSWASVCQKNGLWFTCQPASGGKTHIHDDDLEIFEYFFQKYPNFLGWNYAGQFWGFDEAGNKCSSTQTDRIALFAKLVEMSHRYGGFLTVSYCGNIWSHGLSPLGMMKRDNNLLNACRKYPDAILWLYKYTQPWCFYNTESVTFGPFLAGLAKSYGVRYDNSGWNGALKCVLGADTKATYPVAAGIGTVMEECFVNGGCVWDAPETIPTESFKQTDNTTVNGYTRRNWDSYSGFKYAWTDMFRKIIDGTLYIPTREEVVQKTGIVIINNVTSGSDEDKYASWDNMYDGLYKLTDPFNSGDGCWMNNNTYLKSTGRYGTLAVVPELYDSLAKTIPTQVKKSQWKNHWSTIARKTDDFNRKYPEVSQGDLYVNRFKNQLVTYCPYSNTGNKKGASAVIPLKYNTCETMRLDYAMLSSGVIHEHAGYIDFYLNNYRTDTMTNKTDLITLTGVTEKPSFTCLRCSGATSNVTAVWDTTAHIYTVTVRHNGGVMLKIACAGNAERTDTDIVPQKALPMPQQPEEYHGAIIIEAEDMDFKDIKSCCTNPYYTYPDVRGHSGNGFADMGSSSSGSLRHVLTLKEGGAYRLTVRYTNPTKASSLVLYVNNVLQQALIVEKTSTNEWKDATLEATLKEGSNTLTVNNTSGTAMYLDKVTYTPSALPEEKYAITIRSADHGSVTAPDSAYAGDVVTLEVHPDKGYELSGWTIVHGYFSIDAKTSSFTMPDDIVTLKPVFSKSTALDEIDMDDFLDPSDDYIIYDINGNRLEAPTKGINIIKYKNAPSRKIIVC